MTSSTVFAASAVTLEHDPEELRSRADELLSRSPYTDHEPSVVRRAVDWLGDVVARLLDGFGFAPATATLVAWTILVLGVALLTLVLWRTTRSMTVDLGRGQASRPEATRTPGEWFADADDHAAAGRLRDAVRCRYAGLVAALEASGTIEPLPGRTVRELDIEVASAAPRLAAGVAEAGERFQALVFGRVSATAADLDVVDAAAQAVLGMVGRGSKPGMVGRGSKTGEVGV